MEPKILDEITWNTEISLFGEFRSKSPQISMWLDLTDFMIAPSQLYLRQISSEVDWENYRQLRIKIETPFGITKSGEIEKIIEEMKRIVSNFSASWYLASNSDEVIVGGIGLAHFSCEIGQVGRLLDVDIAPEFQGNGFGRQLLASIVDIARGKNLNALCLKADSRNWVKDWYARIGFQETGVWSPR